MNKILQNSLLLTCLIFVFTFPLFINAQQISISEQFRTCDSIQDNRKALKELERIRSENKLSTKERYEWYRRYIPRTIQTESFDKTFKAAYEGLDLAKKEKHDSLVAYFYKQLGNANYYINRKEEARKFYLKAVDQANRFGYWEIECNTLSNVGALEVDLRNYTIAEKHLLRSIEIYKKHHFEQSPNGLLVYRILATLYTDQNRFKEAEPIYMEIIELAKKTNDTTLMCSSLVNYANLLSLKGFNDKALKLTQEAVALQRLRKDRTTLVATLGYLEMQLSKQKRFEEATEVLREINLINRGIFQDNLNKQIGEVEVKYKTAEIKQQKEVAEAKSKASKLSLKIATREKEMYIFLLSGVVFLSLVVFLLFYIRQQRRKTRQEVILQRERLEAIVEGEEKERSRIAKDLHDGVVQELTAIKINLNSLEYATPEELVKGMKKITQNLDETTRDVREISYQMMPVALRELGLIPALSDMLQKSFSVRSIDFEFEHLGIDERLPEKIEVSLFRISQELVNNVIKHSKANFVSLILSYRDGFISMIFEDNGMGFDSETSKKGIGMNSLKSRVELVNGEIKYEAGNQSGTIAIVRIPFQKM